MGVYNEFKHTSKSTYQINTHLLNLPTELSRLTC